VASGQRSLATAGHGRAPATLAIKQPALARRSRLPQATLQLGRPLHDHYKASSQRSAAIAGRGHALATLGSQKPALARRNRPPQGTGRPRWPFPNLTV
jgi:hypothetical protein